MKSPSSMTDSPSFIHLLIFLLQTSSDFLNTADRFGLYNWSNVGRRYYSFLRFTGSLSLGSWTHGWSSSSVAEIYCCSGLRPSVITPWGVGVGFSPSSLEESQSPSDLSYLESLCSGFVLDLVESDHWPGLQTRMHGFCLACSKVQNVIFCSFPAARYFEYNYTWGG